MIRSLRVAVTAAFLTAPLVAQSDTNPYTSFVIKVPYSFDLPPEIIAVNFRCSINDGVRNGYFYEPFVEVSGPTSGEMLLGFDELGTHAIPESNVFDDEMKTYVLEAMATGRFEFEVECEIYSFSTRSTWYHPVYQPEADKWGLFPQTTDPYAAEAKAWLTTDSYGTGLETLRSFNQAENEALGDFDAGFATEALSNEGSVTTPQQSPSIPPQGSNGLSTLDGLLQGQ